MALPNTRTTFKEYCLRAQTEYWEPRFYYIMKNKTSGIMYIGQTKRDLNKYLGSGIYWKNHCKTHGGFTRENIELIYSTWFFDKVEAEKFLSLFEEQNPNYWDERNKKWANLCKENTENNPFYSNEISIRNMKKMVEEGNHPFLKKNQSVNVKANQTNTEQFKNNMIKKYGVDNALKIPSIAKEVGKKSSKTKLNPVWKATKESIRIEKYNKTMNEVSVDNGLTKKQNRNIKIGKTNKAIIDKKVETGNYHLLGGFNAVCENGSIQWITSIEYKERKSRGCTMYVHPSSAEGKKRRLKNNAITD